MLLYFVEQMISSSILSVGTQIQKGDEHFTIRWSENK